jgi:hypothetical protein
MCKDFVEFRRSNTGHSAGYKQALILLSFASSPIISVCKRFVRSFSCTHFQSHCSWRFKADLTHRIKHLLAFVLRRPVKRVI